MSINKTNIQWTHLPGRDDGYTANPIRFRNRETGEPVTWACVKVSEGCKNCYAESLALRYGKGSAYTVPNMAKLEPVLDEKVIHELLTSRKISGAAVFLGDMTDLFGEWVPDEMLDRIFAVMALRPDVTFQLLTKRPERMRVYLNYRDDTGSDRAEFIGYEAMTLYEEHGGDFTIANQMILGGNCSQTEPTQYWPLPNVWPGTSVEDQAAADERIPHLLATPAAVRFLSCEPLLGPVRLPAITPTQVSALDCLAGIEYGVDPEGNSWQSKPGRRIDWVIVGGESGTHARPCNVEWIRDVVRQCQVAGVPVFVKQIGSKPYIRDAGVLVWPEYPLKSRHGSDPEEWPEDLRVREWPRA